MEIRFASLEPVKTSIVDPQTIDVVRVICEIVPQSCHSIASHVANVLTEDGGKMTLLVRAWGRARGASKKAVVGSVKRAVEKIAKHAAAGAPAELKIGCRVVSVDGGAVKFKHTLPKGDTLETTVAALKKAVEDLKRESAALA